MTKKTVVFFGSFLHYSTKVLESLLQSPYIEIVGAVTTPPALVSTREQGGSASKQNILKNTHTHEYAKQKGISVFTPENLFETDPATVFKTPTTDSSLPSTLQKIRPEFFIVAGYGKMLPESWLSYPTIASLNLHFSMLPDFRGANPAEWAILLGEVETGVSLITMSRDFDTGNLLTRLPLPISEDDTRETLYERLYDLACQIAKDSIPHLDSVAFADPQEISNKPYAYRFNRSHGFIDWAFIKAALDGHSIKDPLPLLSKHLKTAWEYLYQNPSESEGLITPEVFLERVVRALAGFPGVWTYVPTKEGKKRLKVLSTIWDEGILTLDQVQMEGQNPARFNEIKNQIVDYS